jgi:hypothetical protein
MTLAQHIQHAERKFRKGGNCHYVPKPEGMSLDAFHRALRAKAQGKGWRFWKERDVETIRIKPKKG